jgi:hypothetical protein
MHRENQIIIAPIKISIYDLELCKLLNHRTEMKFRLNIQAVVISPII